MTMPAWGARGESRPGAVAGLRPSQASYRFAVARRGGHATAGRGGSAARRASDLETDLRVQMPMLQPSISNSSQDAVSTVSESASKPANWIGERKGVFTRSDVMAPLFCTRAVIGLQVAESVLNPR
jgi:hypothetical protein